MIGELERKLIQETIFCFCLLHKWITLKFLWQILEETKCNANIIPYLLVISFNDTFFFLAYPIFVCKVKPGLSYVCAVLGPMWRGKWNLFLIKWAACLWGALLRWSHAGWSTSACGCSHRTYTICHTHTRTYRRPHSDSDACRAGPGWVGSVRFGPFSLW